jgi:hypothetical protein
LSRHRWSLFATLVFVVMAALPSAATADGTMRVRYRGEFVDDESAPISGVFPLTFKLYVQEDADEAVWEEHQYVAVFEGRYDVWLGSATPLAAAHDGASLFIGVELALIGEVARHALTLAAESPPPPREEVIAELDLTFADLADRALRADHARQADDCTLLGGRSLEEIDRYEELLTTVADLRESLDEVTGVRLGSRTTTLERIGGAGGNSYSRTCPPGHVVTGMRGGAGALIDSVELICSPLQ